ncbi:uncharacterized protein LOC124405225 [Diprion similis]|uniref:uncharacterized protein LOC124405225 n=1 Tax=Diprion similis TaxID=362088 RepID=UPI001EF8300D|nr:uncharacterized protein LOC124405225 [Diprion similis]
MSDIKFVIALLCKDLRQAVDATLKPEHFRLSKFNEDTDNTVIELWKILYQLSSCAAKEIPGNILLNDYDDVTFVKLYFAYLQYPVPEFYTLSLDRGSSRELLIAFAWLLATQNALTVAIDKKISTSILSEEFTDSHIQKTVTITDWEKTLSTKAQLNRIIHVCGQINYNIRAISELVTEKLKLTTKAHAASINVCSLPHLSISEMAIAKRFALNKSDSDQRRIQQLQELASVLDTHVKWETKRHIFFDWMVTVIEEHKKSQVEATDCKESDIELSKFVCLLRHIVKKNIHNLKHKDEISSALSSRSDCVSRLLRMQSEHTEAETWLLGVKLQLDSEEAMTKKQMNSLIIQLKKMLKLIPHCVQI